MNHESGFTPRQFTNPNTEKPIFSSEELKSKMEQLNNDKRPWFKGYTPVKRGEAHVILGLEEDQVKPLLENQTSYWLSLTDIEALQRQLHPENEKADGVETYFSGTIPTNTPHIPEKRQGIDTKIIRAFSQKLLEAYKRGDPRIPILMEVYPVSVESMERYYFQANSKPEIARQKGITVESVHKAISCGLRALEIIPVINAEGTETHYQTWLKPVLSRWNQIQTEISELPSNIQELAWELVRGKWSTDVARNFQLDPSRIKEVEQLRQMLFYGASEIKPFFQEHQQAAIQQLFSTPYADQPIIKSLDKFLIRKVKGEKHDELAKSPLGLTPIQMRTIILHALENFAEMFPDAQGQIPSPLAKRINPTQQEWMFLYQLHKKLIEEMTAQNRSLIPNQEAFLTRMLKDKPKTQDEHILLSLFFGQTNTQRHLQERQELARAALGRGRNTDLFDDNEWLIVEQIAEGEKLSTIGITRNQLARLKRKMKQLVQIHPKPQ